MTWKFNYVAIALGVVLAAISAWLLTITFDFPASYDESAPGPALWPQVLLVGMILLTLGMVALEFLRPQPMDREGEDLDTQGASSLLNEARRLLPLILFPLLMSWVGFLGGTVVFLLLSYVLLGQKLLPWSVPAAVIFPAVVYILFHLLLQVQLP